MREAVYTERTQCRDCYKCVRHCPVKAIRVQESSATIDHDLCIFCGRCVSVCPAGAKKIRNDVPRAIQLLKLKREVYVSLAPSLPVCSGLSEKELIRDLLSLGFSGVSETALGAQAVAEEQRRLLARSNAPQISSACPTVRILAERYFPSAAASLSSLPSPMVAHARMLRRWYGDDIGVVFAGPCIAKKMEADQYPDLIDVALTAGELFAWQRERKTEKHKETQAAPEARFIPHRAGTAALFPMDGGMIRAMGNLCEEECPSMHQSGTALLGETLKSVPLFEGQRLFLELLACEGGCINGPGMPKDEPVISRRMKLVKSRGDDGSSKTGNLPRGDLEDAAWDIILPEKNRYSEADIEAALRKLGKESAEERKECGGCGYSTCSEFAEAFLEGKAEKEMCVTEMRRQAQQKVSALLHTIPMGVVLVDQELRIVECNRRFLDLFAGLPFQSDSAAVERSAGSRIERFLPDTDLFQLLLTRPDTLERIVRIDEKVTRGTFFQIRKGRLVGAVFQDITVPAVRQETVVRKAEEVIRRNLESVQQIAGLLGENAAETEIILNSMINAFEPGEVRKGR
jgi:iron only hydrogenase large subunit-like protein